MNRYSTAAAVAGQADFAGATAAILATGETFPDALAASGLAGANTPAPIILTASNEYSSEAQDALAALGSLDDVFIVGGTAAISQEVEDAVVADGYTVTRVAGNDRFETAAAIAAEIGAASVGAIDGLTTALIATGTGFADALAGGPLAAANTMPILLVNTNDVPASTEAAIADLGIEQVAILGGTAAVSDDVETALETLTGNPAVRIAGTTRFGTAAAAGEFGVAELGWLPEEVLLANGLNFPDALSGGPLGGIRQAPILLLASVPVETSDFLNLHSDTIERMECLGGTAACSEEDLQTAELAGENTSDDAPTGGDTVTSSLGGPELQSVAISGLDLGDLAIVYTFSFDEDVDDSVDGADFLLYNADTDNPADGTVYNDGDDIDVSGTDVAVTYNLANFGVADATLAAVNAGAVVDEDGNENPPQSVEVSGIGNSSGEGLLAAEITDEAEGLVEFTVGTPAIPGLTAGSEYQLIDKDGTVYRANDFDAVAAVGPGQSNTSPDDEEPSTTIEVEFRCFGDDLPAAYDNDECDGAALGDPVDLSDATIRRAIIVSNFAAAPGLNERIQAVDVAGGGSTDGPDLVSVELPSDNSDLEDDQALFIFDEVIDTVGAGESGTAFDLIYSHCGHGAATVGGLNALIVVTNGFVDPDADPQPGEGFDDDIFLGSTCAIPGVTALGGAGDGTADSDAAAEDFGTRAALVTFATDLIDNQFLVAAQVATGSTVADDAGNLALNDEVQYSNAEDLFDDGETTGPQLVGAEATTDTNVFGDFSSYQVTFTFDADLDDGAVLGDGFTFYRDNGSDVEAEDFDFTTCDYDGDNQVVCEIDDEESEIVNAVVVSVEAGTVTGVDEFDQDSGLTGNVFTNPAASIDLVAPEAV